jgi:hypothetical protein
MLAAVAAADGTLAFLSGHVDTTRVGIAGHSQRAGDAAHLTDRPGVRLTIPLAGFEDVVESETLESTLVLGGLADAVAAWDGQVEVYESAPPRKRLVGISNVGHLAMTDLCGGRNPSGLDAIEVAELYEVCGIWSARFLWDCEATHLPYATQSDIVDYATAAALEETLQCADRDAAFDVLVARYPDVGVYEEAR